MSSFKPGDWVYIPSLNTEPAQYRSDLCHLGLELWQPKVGEWCWFYTNKLTTGRRVAPVLKQYRKGDEHMIQERLIRNGNFTNIDDKFAFYQLELIEPFIGQLPSILKDPS